MTGPEARGQKPEARGQGGLLARAAEAVGEFIGRVRAVSLAERPTGRLDHTWSARASTSSPAYEAAAVNRSNADWRTGLTPATAAILEGLDVMLARSRWLIRNEGYAASAQSGYRRRVVGGGITARAAARHPDTGAWLREYNAAHDLLWNAWALDAECCDVERTKCLYEQEALWMDELFAAGGCLLRPVYTPRADGVGLAIQTLEYEQLNRDLTSYGGNAVYNGIETDAYCAPVAYHVYAAAHPLEEQPSASTRLVSGECWHVFRKGRVRQRLGAPMMAAVMPALRNLAMYDLYTVSKARTEAAYHGFIKDPGATGGTIDQMRAKISGRLPEGDSETGQDLQVRVENGLFPVLRGGKTVDFAPSGTPNSVYPAFVSEQLKKIGAGTGLDLPTLARWYADGNFNTQRRASLELEAEAEAIQDLQFVNGALRKIRSLWTDIAVTERKLAAPNYRSAARWRAAYEAANWQGPPVKSVDPIKDEAAWDLKYLSLRGTPQDYYNERGQDAREVLAAWQEFFRMARDEYGLGDVVDGFFATSSPNTPKAGMRPDGSGDDADPADAEPNARPRGGAMARGPGLSRQLANRLGLAALIDDGGGNGNGNGRHG